MTVTCRNCGTVKIDFDDTKQKVDVTKFNNYPAIPEGHNVNDVISERDARGQVIIGRIYCPRDTIPADSIFVKAEGSPEELAAQYHRYLQESERKGNLNPQFVLHRYAKAIANRKRYRKDLARKQANDGKANWPF